MPFPDLPRDQLGPPFDTLPVVPPLAADLPTRGPLLALTPDEINDAILKAALAPQSVTVDGNSATARSARDLAAALDLVTARQRLAAGRPPMRCYRLIPPGTVGPTARPI